MSCEEAVCAPPVLALRVGFVENLERVQAQCQIGLEVADSQAEAELVVHPIGGGDAVGGDFQVERLAVVPRAGPAVGKTGPGAEEQRHRLASELVVGRLVAVEGERPVTARIDQREKGDAAEIRRRLTDLQTGRDVQPAAGGRAEAPSPFDERRRVAPHPTLDRHLRLDQIHQPRRVGERRRGVVRQSDEGAAEPHAARPGIGKAELDDRRRLLLTGCGAGSQKKQQQA